MDAKHFLVLLVDDDDVDVMMVQRAFAKAQLPYPLIVARDGRQALDYLVGQGEFADRTKHPLPCYVMLDLKLPHASGLEILEWMRRTESVKGIPVTMLSGSGERADIEKAQQLGISSYLVKPTLFTDLLTMVKELGRRWDQLRTQR